MIKKDETGSRLRLNIGVMFVILLACMVVGLYVVQIRAQDYATDKSAKIVARQNAIQRENDHRLVAQQTYQTNFTTCGVRALVAPGLKGQEGALIRAKATVNSTTPGSSRNKIAKQAVKDISKQIASTNKVLAIFGTIPPGFNCKNLPKHAPR